MLDQQLLTAAELDAIESANRKRIDEAVAFAESSPLPQPGDLFTDVYVPSRDRGRQ